MTAFDNAFNVVFVGAGNVMFGSREGPWNHSLRFEQALGSKFRLLAIIDPDVERARAVLKLKRADASLSSAYENTQVYASLEALVAATDNLEPPTRPQIQAFVLGCPPSLRGTTVQGADLELQIVRHFPGAALFVEKPVTAGSIHECKGVAQALDGKGIITSVGYMLRYLKAVQFIKRTIQENGLVVIATHARYAAAYANILKPDWWDKSKSGGPIVEQATHFCDLSRYFGGDVDLTTVLAHSVEWHEPPGLLSAIGVNEAEIAPANRIPRATSAIWKYQGGAIGSLTHLATLQGETYDCEMEVHADGYLFKLIDPYGRARVRIRRPGAADEELNFEGDDPFLTEVTEFVAVLLGSGGDGGGVGILSPFKDGCESYELSWAIRVASERK